MSGSASVALLSLYIIEKKTVRGYREFHFGSKSPISKQIMQIIHHSFVVFFHVNIAVLRSGIAHLCSCALCISVCFILFISCLFHCGCLCSVNVSNTNRNTT